MSFTTKTTIDSKADGEVVDPVAIKWNDFAAKEFEETKQKFGGHAIPLTLPTLRSRRPHPADKSPPAAAVGWQAFANDQRSSSRPYKRTDENRRIIIEKQLSRMADPPLCFCNKPATRSETTDFGTVYDCHNWSITEDNTTICAFHIHKDAWDRYRERLRNNQTLNRGDPELEKCPAFNLTFCTVFRTNNRFDKWAPPLPRCYCNLNVRRRSENGRIVYACARFGTDQPPGPKCSWFSFAEYVQFFKPKRPIHDLALQDDHVQEEEQNVQQQEQNHDIVQKQEQSVQQEDAKQVQSPNIQDTQDDKHSVHDTPPSTATADNPNASIYSSISPRITPSPPGELPAPENLPSPPPTNKLPMPSETANDLIRLLEGANMPDWHKTTKDLGIPDSTEKASEISSASSLSSKEEATEDDEKKTTTTKSAIQHMVPAAVFARQALDNNQKRSLVGGNDEVIKKQEEELESLREQVHQLEVKLQTASALVRRYEEIVTEEKQKAYVAIKMNADAQETLQALMSEKTRLQNNLEETRKELQSTRQSLVEEVNLRNTTQRHMADIESTIQELLAVQEGLRDEKERLTERASLKDSICRVCFQDNIEFALVPCFHCGKYPMFD